MLALLILGMWQTYVNHFKVLIGLSPMESELSSKKKPQQDSCCMQLQPAFQKYILIVGFHKLPRI